MKPRHAWWLSRDLILLANSKMKPTLSLIGGLASMKIEFANNIDFDDHKVKQQSFFSLLVMID
jgi:hypothetical protein